MSKVSIIRWLVVPSLLLSGFAAGAEETRLRCEMTDGGVIYLSFENDKKAALVIDAESVKGEVDITDTSYHFRFPRTDTRWETHITINRLTGALTWEHGLPPFNAASSGNVMRSGECGRIERKPML